MRAIDEGLADLNNLLMSLLVDAHRYSYFVKQQGLQDDQCLALSHHKPVSAGYTETSPDSQLSCEPQNHITSLQILLMRKRQITGEKSTLDCQQSDGQKLYPVYAKRKGIYTS